ncbi:hypothetical protein NO135_24540, partial [Clostridioides difficile]|nr:hypothetical protein [Clostridioides difficile]
PTFVVNRYAPFINLEFGYTICEEAPNKPPHTLTENEVDATTVVDGKGAFALAGKSSRTSSDSVRTGKFGSGLLPV